MSVALAGTTPAPAARHSALRARLRLRTRARWWAAALRSVGVRGALRLRRLARGGGTPGRVRTLRPRHAAHPLRVREATSDARVFEQIFVEREYACLDGLRGVETVLDCGANVGYSSAYFLSRWPGARVLAVEPDPENFRALAANLAPYGPRAGLLRAGVWSHPCGLRMEAPAYRGGAEWARQVRESAPGEPAEIEAVDVPALMARLGAERISLLKMDVEGAEAVVFAGECAWLDRVDTLVLELHDDTHFGDAPAVFERAVRGRGFALERSGELTVARRAG
jgi:FkbM family methyltransferase